MSKMKYVAKRSYSPIFIWENNFLKNQADCWTKKLTVKFKNLQFLSVFHSLVLQRFITLHLTWMLKANSCEEISRKLHNLFCSNEGKKVTTEIIPLATKTPIKGGLLNKVRHNFGMMTLGSPINKVVAFGGKSAQNYWDTVG